MANKAGFKACEVGGMLRHYRRDVDPLTGVYQQYPREYGGGYIDPTRTHLNYTIGDTKDESWIKDRLDGVYQRPQDKGEKPVMLDIVVTLPKTENPKDAKKFFDAVYKSLSRRYCKQNNFVGAWVHMDEAQPHIHFAFLPLCPKLIKSKPEVTEGISQTYYFPRKFDLVRMQKETEDDVSKAMGHHVALLNGATAGGNKSIRELKAETARDMQNAKAVKGSVDDIACNIVSIPPNPIFRLIYMPRQGARRLSSKGSLTGLEIRLNPSTAR